ncbi:unnamed protein product [Mytilus coruscus]|uniref:Uncharacterized protein n=1 Tax=Mytilus coruscus TaxID=42192 RepID=A0A6J8C5H8_MYTCO|nr:unnamed protein product [Mytilus coruscus]
MTIGCLMESSFVHMSRRTVGNVNVYHCTCTLFATLLQLATLDEQPDTEIESINIKCCHIRYFKEIIEPDYPIYFSTEFFTSPTKSQKSIMLYLAALQKPVILLLSSLRTKQFSVVPNSSQDCKFVNVSRNRVSCKSGECSAIYSFSTRKVIYLSETSNVCLHLQAMKDHKNLWMNVNDIEEDIEDEDEEAFIDNEEDENDLEDTYQPETTQIANKEDFPSLSEHRPKEEDDQALQRAIKKRLAVFDGAEGVVRDTKGYLTGNNPLVLFPPVLEDGCVCGAGYSDDDHTNGVLTDVKNRTVVYLTNGPARFEVFGRNCLAGNADCQVQYGGSSDSLHFLLQEMRLAGIFQEQHDAIIRKCRDHLAYTSKKALGQLNQTLEFEEELNRNTLLIETVSHQCSDIMRRFVCNEYPESIQKKLAVIFKFLSTNHSLSSLIPFRYTDLLDSILLELKKSTQNHRINLISDFSPEIRDTLYVALPYEQIQRIREKNKEPAPAVRQPSSYNPERYGAAYYFTASGEKLRDIPIYTMNESAHSKNYDDLPTRSNEHCNKIYPEISRRGTTYLSLWFEPKHFGHCNGFHIIPGSEGRKDPFSSAYSYLEYAPEEVFYDCSCQFDMFEKYCLNREPGFWENTRFWHDLFHGYSHKGPFCYKSQRICQLQGLNTEICEQFNSFIQKIKYSSRSMSLGKFCFYLQYMIHQWCEMKRSSFEQRCDIAAAYLA